MTRRLRPTQQRLCGFILQARISLKALDELFGDSTLSAAPGSMYWSAVDPQRGTATISSVPTRQPRQTLQTSRRKMST